MHTTPPPTRRAARPLLAALLLLLSSGCARAAFATPHDAGARADAAAPTDAGATPAPRASPVAWRLEVAPGTTVAMSARRAVRIWMVAHNTGAATVDTERDRLEFTVNGRPSMTLGMAFGNGGREARWHALPPGDTVREARDLGEALFTAPGAYEIALCDGGVTVARVQVRVVAGAAAAPAGDGGAARGR